MNTTETAMNLTIMECPPPISGPTVVLSGFVLATVCAGGFLLNVIGGFTLVQRYLHQTVFRVYVYALCVADCLTLVSVFFTLVLPRISDHRSQRSYSLNLLVLVFYPLLSAGRTMSAWLIIVMTLARYASVHYPFAVRQYSTKHFACVIVLITCSLAFLFNVPKILETEIVPCRSKDEPTSHSYTIEYSPLRETRLYQIVYINIFYNSLVFVVPLLLLMVLNAFTAARIFKYNRFRRHLVAVLMHPPPEEVTELREPTPRQLSGSGNDKNTVSYLLLAISAVFLACHVLLFAANIIELGLPPVRNSKTPDSALRTTYHYLLDLGHILMCINAACNFLIYLFFSRHFRRQVTTRVRSMAASVSGFGSRRGSALSDILEMFTTDVRRPSAFSIARRQSMFRSEMCLNHLDSETDRCRTRKYSDSKCLLTPLPEYEDDLLLPVPPGCHRHNPRLIDADLHNSRHSSTIQDQLSSEDVFLDTTQVMFKLNI